MRDTGAILEAAPDGSGRRWRIRVIGGGLSGNGNFYPADVLRRAVPLFEGVRVFVKSDEDHLRGAGRDVRNLVGRIVDPEFAAGDGAGEILASLELIEADGDVARKLREAWSRDMTALFGFSIDAQGRSEPRRPAGRTVRHVLAIDAVHSVDLIAVPGARGQILNLIEGQKDMDEELLDAAAAAALIEATKLPPAAKQKLIEMLDADEKNSKEDVERLIEAERRYLARVTPTGRVTGLGDDAHDIRFGEGRPEKVARMLDAFFDPADRSVRSIRECYLDITGDRNFTGLLRNCDQARLREAIGSQDWGSVLGDALQRRLVEQYRTPNAYDVWRALVSVVPVSDFRTQERVRFGGYGDLPIVAERNNYLELTSPTDEKATYAIAKRGGTEQLTLEMITNDDVGAVQRIPNSLMRAAKRTLSKFVLDFIRTNPTIYDTVALFHASHNNLGSTALGAAAVAAGRLAIKQQTEMDSEDRLGIGPRYLWVPDELEETAVDLFRRNTENDKNFVQSLTLEVMPVWYWTDTTDWALTTDPNDVPTIELGFLNGQEEPELFVQDMPSSGSMFANDTLTHKIRHIYGGNVVDYRGMFKAVVA